VRMLRAIFVVVAIVAVVARYLAERRRLGVVERLSGAAGLAYLERTRARGDRFVLVLAVLLAAGAAAGLTALVLAPR
jgi:hypothetical protein